MVSNYQLRAEVSRLEAQLREIQIENNQLISEIRSAVSSVNQIEQSLSDYNKQIQTTIDNATGVIDHCTNSALDAYELQGQVDLLYTRYKCVELANKKIRALNNKKYYDFKNYRNVRKIVKGMMDNLDLGMVSDAVIYKSIERQHLLTPDYWLTCALISIMAWRSDDKQLADRALESAFKLDAKNSSIFYMIFNLRMERNQAAVKWFLEYQKCELKGSDGHTFLMLFSLISKTLSDNVDDETSRMISDFIHDLMMECAQNEGYGEENIISFILGHMRSLMKTGSYELPFMVQYCCDCCEITRILDLARNNYNILEFILKIINVPVDERNTYLKEYLNELLEKPNHVEIETYNEIEYNEFVIQMGGDVESARSKFAEELEHRESEFNIISAMIDWVYDFSNISINAQMRLNMFTLIKSLQQKAADLYFADYRAMFQNIHPVKILDYSGNVDFANEEGEKAKIEQYYEELQKQELLQVKNIAAYLSIGLGVVCGAAALFVSPFLFAGLGIGAVAGTSILIFNHSKRKSIRLNFRKQKESVTDILKKLFAEYKKVEELYGEYDVLAVKISEELAKL